LFGARLGPRIRMMGPDWKIEPPQPGDDLFLTCRNCGSTYPVRETKVEPELSPIKEPSNGKCRKRGIEGKRKGTTGRGKGRGNNTRSKKIRSGKSRTAN